ncbi:MAG: FeoC-like transcriptional regulator [Propionibacteriaceae bacterium]|jgi:hypothetical protein|nr:FeoC-like transcriptional regulator [Propionibacteriaceae bacterium]
MSPLSVVMSELKLGTPTVATMKLRTGLSADVLQAALDHLVRLGKVCCQEVGGCAPERCGTCPLLAGCAGAEVRLKTYSLVA